jgi:hypothetical protein
MGSDAPEFLPVLRGAKQRNHRLHRVLADAGFDSHENHRVAREELKIRSLIKVGIGRPTHKPLSSKYRRRMQQELNGSQQAKPYGQRAQSETFNSMFKRNLADHLRSRTGARRRRELTLRVIVHNLMILRCSNGGSRQSPPDPLIRSRIDDEDHRLANLGHHPRTHVSIKIIKMAGVFLTAK